MAIITDKALEFRRALLERERAAALELVRAYGVAYARISAALDALLRQIDDARAAGEEISEAWLLRQNRYITLLAQIRMEIGRFADLTGSVTMTGQSQAIDQAIEDSAALIETAAAQAGEVAIAGTFNRISRSAMENLVGFLADGSPLANLLGELGPEAAATVKEGLINGLAQGKGAVPIAREIRGALNGSMFRALRIARTEVLRSYRETTHQQLQESELVEGWIWLSARNSRTCRVCIALHGTFHLKSERMKSHVNCRCVAVPAIKGQESRIEKGAEWFAKQPEKFQREILDRAGEWEAYKAGKVALEDFVGLRKSEQWGDSYQALGLKRALAGEGKFPGDAKRTKPKPAPKPKQEPAGPFTSYAKRPPKGVTVGINADTRKRVREMLGRKVSDRDLAWAMGALDGSQVEVMELMTGDIYVITRHPDLRTQERYLTMERGQPVIKNEYFAKRDGTPAGIGAKSFGRQVVGAQRLGIKKIRTLAAGSYGESMNGYYTWPRLGYNAPLSDFYQQALPPNLKSKDLHELFAKPGGPEWWLVSGAGIDVEFDLTPGSAHERRMWEYLRKRDREEKEGDK